MLIVLQLVLELQQISLSCLSLRGEDPSQSAAWVALAGLASAVAASHGEARSPSRKPQVQTSSSSGASLLQLPSLSDQAAQHEALAKDYAKQVQMARQNAQGRGQPQFYP